MTRFCARLAGVIAGGLLTACCTWCQAPNKADSKLDRGRQFLGLPPPPDPAAAARGQKFFGQNCGFCHGPNANGAEGPNLLRSTLVLHDTKGETLGPFLLKGRPDKGMPSFATLSEAQIFDVAEFLHSRVDEVANRSGYKVLNLATGSAEQGKAFFNGEGHCNQCHSVTGDLAHIASKLEPPDLETQFLYPSGKFDDDDEGKAVRPKVTVTLPNGETVSGTLKRMDDFEIWIYDGTGTQRSFSRDKSKVEMKDPLAAHRELLAKYSDAEMHDVLTYLVTLK